MSPNVLAAPTAARTSWPGRSLASGLLVALLVVAAVSPVVPAARAQTPTWTEDAGRLASPDPQVLDPSRPAEQGANNRFGGALAAAGGLLVVGGLEKASTGRHPERVFVYERDGAAWAERASLTSPDTSVTGEFGRSVAISPDGSTIVVGAPHLEGAGGESQAGAAYVFTGSGSSWTLAATLRSPNPGANDRFGVDVAIDGDVIVIGAEGDRGTADPNVLNGAAYVFLRTAGTWGTTPAATLRAPDDPLPVAAGFGQRVAISGDTIAVGDVGCTTGCATKSNSVHVYTGGGATWTWTTRFDGVFDGAAHDLAIDGDLLVVGVSGISGGQLFNPDGEAHAVVRQGGVWGAPVPLRPLAVAALGDAAVPEWFGAAVAVDGDLIAVGAMRGDGAVLLFEHDGVGGITFGSAVTAAAEARVDLSTVDPAWLAFYLNVWRFGGAVALDGAELAVGAPHDCHSSSSCGGDWALVQRGLVLTFSDPSRTTTAGPSAPTPSPDETATSSPSWVPTPAGLAPQLRSARGELQPEGGAPAPLEVTAPSPGRVAYADGDGRFRVTFTGAPATDVALGLVVGPDGLVECEVCGTMSPGDVLEVWAFSEPRLVAATLVGPDSCTTFTIPLASPLDGGVAVPTGDHTLQLIAPTAEGRVGLNVGITVGPPRPTAVRAGDGTVGTVVRRSVGTVAAVGFGVMVAVVVAAGRRRRVGAASGTSVPST